MHLKVVILLVLLGARFGLGEEVEELEETEEGMEEPADEGTEEVTEAPTADPANDIEVPLTVAAPLEDIDVLCSRPSPDSNEREWTWLDVSDLNVLGYWREYGVCIDKSGTCRFRFRAFHLDHPPSYDILKERCQDNGYDYAQPARMDPDQASPSFGWPDRGYKGLYGPPSHHLGSGRSDSTSERQQELATDGWYAFRVDEELFTPGFLSVEPCKRVQLIKQYFELQEIPCQNYKKC